MAARSVTISISTLAACALRMARRTPASQAGEQAIRSPGEVELMAVKRDAGRASNGATLGPRHSKYRQPRCRPKARGRLQFRATGTVHGGQRRTKMCERQRHPATPRQRAGDFHDGQEVEAPSAGSWPK